MKIKDICNMMDEIEKLKDKILDVASNYPEHESKYLNEVFSNAELWAIIDELLCFKKMINNVQVDYFND